MKAEPDLAEGCAALKVLGRGREQGGAGLQLPKELLPPFQLRKVAEKSSSNEAENSKLVCWEVSISSDSQQPIHAHDTWS